MPLRLGAACALAVLALAGGGPAAAKASDGKKAIWGPVQVAGVSQFPIYHQLGVGIFQISLNWATTAPTRPAKPRDPNDRAYRWPSDISYALAQASVYGMRVLVEVNGAPRWANGGRSQRWAPKRPSDYADFLRAAAKEYPGVRLWLIWGEPSKATNFQPLSSVNYGQRTSAAQRRGPRVYAQILDAAYGALKSVSRRNLVIGGNTWTVGAITPLEWVKLLRLPNGRPPRMDLYGHNPFSARPPRLGSLQLGNGIIDFSNLDVLAHAVDRNLARPRHKRHLRLFLSEFTIPTDHANWEYNYWVDQSTAAQWLGDALRIVRSWSDIYAFGWLGLYDDPPRADGQEVNGGLLTFSGQRKPAFQVFADG